MIDKEVSELRRRLRPEHNAITHLYGCYISSQGELLAEVDESMALLPQEEQEKYLELLKKGVSGSMGRTLSDLVFTTAQVQSGEEHALLRRLRDSRLTDAEARAALYRKIAGSLRLGEDNYLVLLACDVYDVPFRGKDGISDDSGDTQFSYLVCAISPVREAKPVMRYDAPAKTFHNRGTDWVVAAPALGFLFPAFDDRAANLYAALLCNRCKDESHEGFVEAVFHTQPPMAVGVRQDAFREVLTDALEEELRLEVVQTMHGQLRELAAAHKEARDPEPLTVSCEELSGMLEDAGVSEPKAAAFRVRYEEAFGTDSELPPQNLLGPAQLEYKTPDATIRVAADRQDLVSFRELGGVKYLLVKAEEGVELNGVPVRLEPQES